MQTILGANGTIGTLLAKELTKYTSDIRLVSRHPRQVNLTDQLLAADLAQANLVDRAVAGSEIVYLVVDEPNLLYELEKCKEEINMMLGPDHTFSAECPFGTENERVMEYAYKIHPALRNRMPEPFLEEINRWNDMTPGLSNKPYIQWQRGPLTKTPVPLMKSWVDTLVARKNVWLVLTFHGVDGIGWEAKPHQELQEYFSYMKQHGDHLWIAPFRDATKYMRERMAAKGEQPGRRRCNTCNT